MPQKSLNAWQIKLSLFLNYFVFAILLNSVGTVILQVQRNYGITASAASILEAYKDLSIALVSFLATTFITRIGYKRSMLLGLAFVTVACLAMPLVPGFWMTKLLFAATGASFALVKVSVLAAVGLVTRDKKEHASFMSFLESFFMVGILSGYFIFGVFTDDTVDASTEWLHVYYVLAGMAALAFLILLTARLDERKAHGDETEDLAKDAKHSFGLIASPLVLVFIGSVFTYVLIEQGIMSWLPTFNNQVLHLPATLGIQMASILAASTALGRFLGGIVLRRIHWFAVLAACLVCAAALVLVALPLAGGGASTGEIRSWFDAPLAAWIFPLIGLFLAPIYPTINSAVLSSLPQERHGAMSGLIVIFSALGGTTGSIITGHVFETFGGRTAFYGSLIPLTVLLGLLVVFNSLQKRHEAQEAQR